MNVFIFPVVARPVPKPAAIPSKPKRDLSDNWEDAAYNQRWKSAVALFVLAHRVDKPTLWRAVKAVVNTSLPASRNLARERTNSVLFAVGRLVREGRIRRVRRKWLLPPEFLFAETNMADFSLSTCGGLGCQRLLQDFGGGLSIPRRRSDGLGLGLGNLALWAVAVGPGHPVFGQNLVGCRCARNRVAGNGVHRKDCRLPSNALKLDFAPGHFSFPFPNLKDRPGRPILVKPFGQSCIAGLPVRQVEQITGMPNRWSPQKPRFYWGLERVKGIEPSSQAWEAHVLPLNHTRTHVELFLSDLRVLAQWLFLQPAVSCWPGACITSRFGDRLRLGNCNREGNRGLDNISGQRQTTAHEH
jgi:hypothetical protein